MSLGSFRSFRAPPKPGRESLLFSRRRYLAVASNPASKSKAPGAGRREASTSREWKLEALADLCEDHTFEHAVRGPAYL